jgi:hypothetical protein
LLTLFDDLDVNTDSLQWIYPSDVFYTLKKWDYEKFNYHPIIFKSYMDFFS